MANPIGLNVREEQREIADNVWMNYEIEVGLRPDVVNTSSGKVVGHSQIKWAASVGWKECCPQSEEVSSSSGQGLLENFIVVREFIIATLTE